MLTTTRLAVPYPNESSRADRPDVPLHMKNLALKIDTLVTYDQGTNAARIAAAHVTSGGRYWWTTDTLQMWYDDGTTWRVVGPGAQIDYAQVSGSDVTCAAGSESTATTIVASNSVTYDGTKVRIEMLAAGITALGGSGVGRFVLLRDSTVLGQFGVTHGSIGSAPVNLVTYDTPSAAAHVYTWKGWGTSTFSFSVEVGAGGTGADLPASIRITRA